MTDVLKDTSAEAMADACERNLHALLRTLEDSPHNDFVRNDGVLRWNASFRHPWFQGVMSTRPARDGDGRAVEEATAYFKSAGVPGFSWWLEPQVRDQGWEPLLAEHGFTYDENTPGMGIELNSFPEVADIAGVEIRMVMDGAGMDAWARTCSAGFGMGEEGVLTMKGLGRELPLRHYIAVIDGEVVATSTLFLGSGVAGVYNVATLELARRKGIGAAITLAPLRDARELGYMVGILQSSEMGYGVYERMGFKAVRKIGNWFLELEE